MLASLSRFVSKGTIAAVGAIASFVMGQYGYADLAATLTDPEFLQKVFNWIAMGLTLYAGIAQGIKPKDPAHQVQPDVQPKVPDLSDPYPGWDWDPLHGWVKTDGT